jgi:hypothetical protein
MGRPAALFRRLIGYLFAAGALLAAAPATAQSLVCCNIVVDVKGNWLGTGRKCDPKSLSESQRSLVCEQLKSGD